MKTIKTALLLAAAAVMASAADDASLSGKWRIQRSAAGNDSQQDCIFTQNKGDLSGTCDANGSTVAISGKVDGKSVTWTYKGDSQGGPVTVVYNGTVESPAKITGKVTAVEFSIDGDFTAARSK